MDAALDASASTQPPWEVSREPRDEGADENAIYQVLARLQNAPSADSVRADRAVDNKELIWGGRWEKGEAISERKLTKDELASRRAG